MLLLNAQGVSKSYGAAPLFRNISFNVSQGDRVGLIGPNGSGKTTLLEILARRRDPDSGEVALRKGTRLSYVEAGLPSFPQARRSDPSYGVRLTAPTVPERRTPRPGG